MRGCVVRLFTLSSVPGSGMRACKANHLSRMSGSSAWARSNSASACSRISAGRAHQRAERRELVVHVAAVLNWACASGPWRFGVRRSPGARARRCAIGAAPRSWRRANRGRSRRADHRSRAMGLRALPPSRAKGLARLEDGVGIDIRADFARDVLLGGNARAPRPRKRDRAPRSAAARAPRRSADRKRTATRRDRAP